MRISRILGIWAVLAGLMALNGALREAILTPALGGTVAGVASVILGMSIVIFATRLFLSRELPQTPIAIFRVSAIWLGLTALFEVGLGWTSGRTWAEMANDYALWNGSLWVLILLSVAVAPFLWLKRIDRQQRVDR